MEAGVITKCGVKGDTHDPSYLMPNRCLNLAMQAPYIRNTQEQSRPWEQNPRVAIHSLGPKWAEL